MANQVVYGFESLVERFGDRVTTVGIDVVNTAITTALTFHQQQMDAMMALFVQKNVPAKRRYKQHFTARNQPLDEFGFPLPIKGVSRYEIGFPLHRSGNRIGWTYEDFQYVTVQDVNDKVNSI